MRAMSVVCSMLLVSLLVGFGGTPALAMGGHSNWGDFALEIKLGSAELGFQKRLSQGGLEQWKCRACAHYLEAWLESEEVDAGGRDRDVSALGLGYRFYFLTGDENPSTREGLAAFLRLGLSRVELDTPDVTRSGYYGGLGIQYPIRQSWYQEESGDLAQRPFWMSVILTATHNEIETNGVDLDYFSTKVGLRFVFPSRRDKARAACLNARVNQVHDRITKAEREELSSISTTEGFAAAIERHSERHQLPRPPECHERDSRSQ